ncbi:hypothetical protein GALMADRAFT_209879 [Galerina marginata CBS 339.88]|uniref:Uncharacterized protein n=1 Tax=Galerina marginata (strain CBS 339.88) TaxID=685588 RepID=A0A067T360_GALM3|nr:hypothetical protein GALMADRAFT_209879 [Galerina marginata CBS 339.88]
MADNKDEKKEAKNEHKDLKVGDLITTDVLIDINDLANPASTSGTSKKIKRGIPTPRLCVVLSVMTGNASVGVTYMATFDRETTLPTTLDPNFFYPIAPALQGKQAFVPLAGEADGEAQWASLRHTFYINGEFKKKEGVLPVATANAIKAAMKG